MADQGAGSLVNFLPTLIAAATLDPRDFGALATVMAVILTSQAIIRASTGEVAQVVHVDRELWTPSLRHAADSTVGWLAGLAGAVTAASALLVGQGWWGAGASFVLCYLYCQNDAGRALLMIDGRLGRRLTSNLAVLVAQASLLAVIVVGGWSSFLSLVWAWAIALAVGIVVLGRMPRHAVPTRWWTVHSNRIRSFVLEGLAASGVLQLSLLLIGGMQGLESLAAVRAAILLVFPLTFATQVLGQVVYVLIARRPERSLVAWLQLGMALMTIGVTGLIYATPERWLEELLGGTSTSAVTMLFPVALYHGASAAALPASAFLRARGRFAQASVIRVALAPVALGVAATGALFSAYAAVVGLAGMNLTILAAMTIAAVKWRSPKSTR